MTNRSFIAMITIAFLTACAPQSTEMSHADRHPIISAYSDAYNAKDLDAMAALMHPDIEWLSVNGTEIEVAVSGKADLTKAIVSFFDDPNMGTGSHRGWSDNGNFVAVTEIASWTNKAGEAKSQSALTVYELENKLIRRVYYYPAR